MAQIRDDRPIVVPAWFRPSAAYAVAPFSEAASLGRTAGSVSTLCWEELEPTLRDYWRESEPGMSWEEPRGAIYQAWQAARAEPAAQP